MMKALKIGFLVLLCIVTVGFDGYSQNIETQYRDFTGDTVPSITGLGPMKGHVGEYQWFLGNDLKWEGEFDLRNSHQSYKIEVLSWPFVADTPRTRAAGAGHRILTLPSGYSSETKLWTENVMGVGVLRIDIDQAYDHDSTVQNLGTARPINPPSTLHSNLFTTNPSAAALAGRRRFPHTILRHTLYLHCGSDETSEKIDSISFVVDHTRGRMSYYPFSNQNLFGSLPPVHDVTVQSLLYETDSFNSSGNVYNTYNYYSLELPNGSLIQPSDCSTFFRYPDSTETIVDPTFFGRPSQFALPGWLIRGPNGVAPAGYKGDSLDVLYEIMEGVEHMYVIDKNIDISLINPVEKVVFNPGKVEIEADSLIFPTNYTFKTIRSVYPTQSEVDSDTLCQSSIDIDPRDQYVETDLSRSVYTLKAGSRVYLQECVTIYDADFVVMPAAELIYSPSAVNGNFSVIDSGGTITTLSDDKQCIDCLCNQEYDYNDGITISGTVTWTNDLSIKGKVTIPNNTKLIIDDGATIRFADSKRFPGPNGIVVEEGGTLDVIDGTLTTFFCDDYWDGIQVHGDTGRDQSLLGAHGRVRLRSNAVIERARVGVYSGIYYPINEIVDVADYAAPFVTYRDYFKGGGIIRANGATFRNNRRSVVFAHYNYKHTSRFENCFFIHDSIPAPANYDTSNALWVFAELREVRGVRFLGCTFEKRYKSNDYSLANRGTGIRSRNSELLVFPYETVGNADDSTRFIGLGQGIDHSDWMGIEDSVLVAEAVFEDCLEGITTPSGRYTNIINSRFAVPDATNRISGPFGTEWEGRSTWGIYLLSNQAVNVSGNRMTGPKKASSLGVGETFGAIVRNSGGLGGNVYKNTTGGLNTGLQSEWDNQFLSMLCNEHTNHDQAWYVGPSDTLPPSTVLSRIGDQGSGCGPEQTAGNLFDIGSACNDVLSDITSGWTYHANGFPTTTVPDCLPFTVLDNCINSTLDDCPDLDSLLELHITPTTTLSDLVDDVLAISDTVIQTLVLNDLVESLIANGSYGTVVDLLDTLNTVRSKSMLFEFCLSQGAYNDCQTLLNQMPTSTLELQHTKSLYQVLLDIYEDGRIPTDADSSERATLETIADTLTIISGYARSLLSYINDENSIVNPILPPNPTQPRISEDALTSGAGKVQLYPNPANSNIFLEASEEIARVIILDINGRVMVTLESNALSINIDLSEYPGGLYISKVILKDSSLSSHTFIKM